jgi:hypothetical protein
VDDTIHYTEQGVVSRVSDNLGQCTIPFVSVFDGLEKCFVSKYYFSEGRSVLQSFPYRHVVYIILRIDVLRDIHEMGSFGHCLSLHYAVFVSIA